MQPGNECKQDRVLSSLIYQNDNFGAEGFLIFDTDPQIVPGQALLFSEIPSLRSGAHPFIDNKNKMSRSPGRTIVIDSIATGDTFVHGGLSGPERWDIRDFGIQEDPSSVFIAFYTIQNYVYGPLP